MARLIASSAGPSTPGTVAAASSGSCSDNSNWSITAGALTSNDTSYEQITGTAWDSGNITDQLRMSDFGFSLTGGTVTSIDGFQVDFLGWTPTGAPAASYNQVSLFTAPGSNRGDNKASGTFPTADPDSTYQTFGATNDDWYPAGSWTQSEVESANFGVALCLTAGEANATVNVDQVRITVTYTVNVAPTLSVSQPDGVSDTVTAGNSYNITYTSSDSDDTVTTAFFYDTDNTGLDGVAISGPCATVAEGTGVTCAWDTTGVTPGTYYVYGITDDGVNPSVSAYSSGQITIDTAPAAPTVSTDAESNVGVSSATLNGTVSATPGSSVTERGFAWGTDSSFSTKTATTSETGTFGTGSFSQNISGLLAGTQYFFRAYAINTTGTGFGGSDNFTAGTDSTVRRSLRLFEGFILKILNGARLIINQQ